MLGRLSARRAIGRELLQTRADLLHNRQVLRSQLVVRNGFSRLLVESRASRKLTAAHRASGGL